MKRMAWGWTLDEFKGKTVEELRACLEMMKANNAPGLAAGMEYFNAQSDADLGLMLDYCMLFSENPKQVMPASTDANTLNATVIMGRLACIGFYTIMSLMCGHAIAAAERKSPA